MTMTIDYNSDSEQRWSDEICSLAETIGKMRERESEYAISDYLHQPSVLTYQDAVDMNCRSQMIEWIVGIIDHCKFSRITASIAINYLDRFLMTTEWALADRSAFQLAFVTCLYIAIKIHEPTILSLESVESLIRHVYTKEQIASFEILVLNTNKWRMNPSTSFHFAICLCELVSLMDSRLHLETLKELITLQLESTLNDYDVGLLPASTVAFAAVMNAVDSMDVCSVENLEEIESSLQSLLQTDPAIPLQDIRIRLYEGILNDQSSPSMSIKRHPVSCAATSHMPHSPRSVSTVRVVSP